MEDDQFPDFLTAFEREAVVALMPELIEYLDPLGGALCTIERLVSPLHDKTTFEPPLAQRVAVALLIHLANDLRTEGLLASIGYHVQAASIVASAHERTFTIARIVGDDESALRWGEFDDPTHPFRPMRNLIEEACGRHAPGAGKAERDSHYRTYRQLCLAKHGNPLLLRQHSFRLVDGEIELALGPQRHEEAMRVLQFVLMHALGMASFACGAFATVYANDDADIHQCLVRLFVEWQTLSAKFTDRWGQDDPYPGKW